MTETRSEIDARVAKRDADFLRLWAAGARRAEIMATLGLTVGIYDHSRAKFTAAGLIQPRPVGRPRVAIIQVDDQPIPGERMARPDTTRKCSKCRRDFRSANGVMFYCDDCKRHSEAWQSGASNIVLAGVRISERP